MFAKEMFCFSHVEWICGFLIFYLIYCEKLQPAYTLRFSNLWASIHLLVGEDSHSCWVFSAL